MSLIWEQTLQKNKNVQELCCLENENYFQKWQLILKSGCATFIIDHTYNEVSKLCIQSCSYLPHPMSTSTAFNWIGYFWFVFYSKVPEFTPYPQKQTVSPFSKELLKE